MFAKFTGFCESYMLSRWRPRRKDHDYWTRLSDAPIITSTWHWWRQLDVMLTCVWRHWGVHVATLTSRPIKMFVFRNSSFSSWRQRVSAPTALFLLLVQNIARLLVYSADRQSISERHSDSAILFENFISH